MCADVARGHGGDCGGGGDPPGWHSSRIPTSCETSKQKNKRGPSKGKNLEATWIANGKKPLPVMFDISYEGTYNVLGDSGTKMNTLIGSLVRTYIPPYYLSWDLVPEEDKARILPRVESFFDIGRNTRDWKRINDGLDRYCGRRYSDSKSKLHKHFKDHGGKDDVDRARRNPPSRFISRPAVWNKTIDDVFLNPKWQDRSMKNSNSRKKQLFPSFHGTRTYINARFEKMNPETKEIQSAIDNWHENHYKEISGWPNEAVRLAYEKLIAEREKSIRSQQASCSSNGALSSSNGASSSSQGIKVYEREIFHKVFGERRGHTIGIGRKLKRPSGLPSSSSTTSTYETMQEMIRAAQKASDQHHEEQNRKRYEDLISALLHVIPNANVATFPPFESTPAPQFDYNAFMASTSEVQQSKDDEQEEDTTKDN